MLQPEPSSLLKTLNHFCTRTLEAAAGMCVSRGHYEVTVEHFLIQQLEDPNADLYLILRHFEIDRSRVIAALQRHLELQRTGNTGRPVLSPLLLTWIQDAWLLASTELRLPATRSGALLAVLILTPHSYTTGSFVDLLTEISPNELRKELLSIAAGSMEEDSVAEVQGSEVTAVAAGPHSRGTQTALGRFTLDYTAQARVGELDPVIGRESEIRQCIDILARRRKNNPIIVGDAGVGKTALVEGIAQRVVADEVPSKLANVDILSLDLGLLQAGAGVKGEFENRLKAVIDEVKASPKPIILFIDEAHTMIGAGGPAGGSDAANLLKPALARGELRTLAATTWSEYKKYFEKDPALTRRFQLVKVEEPSEDKAIAMMRGLTPHYEESHQIRIRDDAVVAAVRLSNRYISGRLLPDKAVDLLDTCAARVSISQEAQPAALLDLQRTIQILEGERAAVARDLEEGNPVEPGQMARVEQDLVETHVQLDKLKTQWEQEHETVQQILKIRHELFGEKEEQEQAELDPADDAAAAEADASAAEADDAAAEETAEKTAEVETAAEVEATAATEETASEATPERSTEELKHELEQSKAKLDQLQTDAELVSVDVTPDLVASVVSDWTGIPIGKMVQDEASTLLEMEQLISQRIKGQDHALKLMAEVIRASKLGLGNPDAPNGVFLLVGPSGVGKTETGLAFADLLFGGERSMVSVNMSEFQEKHTVSRLIGSPPGYVGYGEGGVLTEAVRQRPYSAVMLDEVEKADPEVMNLFYQVFDKGVLADGEGREIDFKNTVMLMTSNLGSDVMMQMCMSAPPPTRKQVVDAIRPILIDHFKPALLARMTLVPYFPLSAQAMREIVDLKLKLLQDRIMRTQRIELSIDDKVAEQITQRCSEVETGARNIDHILSRTLLPLIARAVLTQMAEGAMPDAMDLGLDQDGEYTLNVLVQDCGQVEG
jgi:type VI secretion system protein VasG